MLAIYSQEEPIDEAEADAMVSARGPSLRYLFPDRLLKCYKVKPYCAPN
jgi:hypothetical protein